MSLWSRVIPVLSMFCTGSPSMLREVKSRNVMTFTSSATTVGRLSACRMVTERPSTLMFLACRTNSPAAGLSRPNIRFSG